MQIIQKPSPNFTKGRGTQKIEAIVIHIMAGSLVGTDSWFATPTSQVSAHYGIGFNGEVHQYVQDADTAWHAGAIVQPTSWSLLKLGINPNSYTLGIEHEGQDLSKGPVAQINATVELIRTLAAKYNVPIDRQHIIGHYQIKSSKPNCPATDKSIIDHIITLANINTTEEQVNVTIPKSKLLKAQQFLSNL